MVNHTAPVTQQGGVTFDFSFIPMEYLLILVIIVFVGIIGIMLFIFRGTPMMFAMANLKKRDILLINMPNNRLEPVIPEVVQNCYFVKGKKKASSLSGFWYINPKSIVKFGNTNASLANSHQAVTIPLSSAELMTSLQNEERLGLRVNTYKDMETIIKYGELKAQEKDIPEALEIKFTTLVEQMQNLDHLKPLTIIPKTEKGDIKIPSLLNSKDRKRLGELIAQSKLTKDFVKSVKPEDLELLKKAEGNMCRGQTTELRGIRGFLDDEMKIPGPKVVSVLVQNAVSKMRKAEDIMKMMIWVMLGITLSGIIAAVIIMLVLQNG